MLFLDGDYSHGVTFGPHTVTGIEDIVLTGGNSYALTTNDATVAAGKYVFINGEALTSGDTLTVDSRAETDGTVNVLASPGHDHLIGGPALDRYSFRVGDLSASDRIDGGSGYCDLALYGDFSGGFTFGPHTIKNVLYLNLYSGSFNVTMNDANVAAGHNLFVFGPYGTGYYLLFDGSKETDGRLYVRGGLESDLLIGGHGDDTLYGRESSDRLIGGPGHDTFQYFGVAESTGIHHDRVAGANFNLDKFQFDFTVTGVNHKIAHGHLASAHYNKNLAQAVDASHLGRHHAVLFTPDSGDAAGSILLIVDANGKPGYQAGHDFVIALQDPQHLAHLDVGDFVT